MSKSIERRRFLVGTAALSLGATTGTVAFAGERGTITIAFDGARRLAGLEGEKLRRALARSLTLRVEGKFEAVPARLHAVRMGREGDVDVFASRSFKVAPGKARFPGEMLFPGDMLFPGEMLFSGEMLFPGEMLYPEKGAEREVMRQAKRALRGRPGWFFIVVAEAEGIGSSGSALS